MNKTIKFTGINRTVPQQEAPDGSCQEIINARYRDGAWRPIGPKSELYSATFTDADGGATLMFYSIFLHDIEGGINPGSPNFIGLRIPAATPLVAYLYLIDMYTNVCTLIEGSIPFLWKSSVDLLNMQFPVVFLKRTMIVTSTAGLYVYLYSEGKYTRLGALPTPYVNLTSEIYYDPAIAGTGHLQAHATVITELAHAPDAVLGNFYAALNQQSANYGRLYGSILYIVAYRLFDGSYILHSMPRYKELSNGGILRTTNPDGSGLENAVSGWVLNMASVSGVLVNTYPSATYDNLKEIVDSIVVFSTKATPIFKVDDTTVTEAKLRDTNWAGINQDWGDRNFTALFPLNSPDFDDLCASSGWYQILEYSFAEIVGAGAPMTKLADTKGFYQDYATRTNLPADQFSHHGLTSKTAYVYNDRLHIGSVKTLFGNPYITWEGEVIPGYTQYFDVPGVITVNLSTSLGKVTRVYQGTFPRYHDDTGGSFVYIKPGIIGYNDSRATHMTIALDTDNTGYKTVMSVDLKKNVGMNFAYYHSTLFAITNAEGNNYSHSFLSTLGDTYTIPTETVPLFDTNRIQVSEIQNPLVYQAKNSYQVSTGEILAMAAGSTPLSQGQFGAFPLQVFTSKGIWALQQGSGDILYSNILPINGEVVNNPKNVISAGSGVIYSTLRGLYLIEGMEVTELSKNIGTRNAANSPINDLAEITTLLTDSRFTPGLANALSETGFLDYLDTSQIGYDKVNNEMFVTCSAYGYSYFYSIENKYWAKLGRSYSLLINDYPRLLGVRGAWIENICDDIREGPVEVMIISNALSLEMPDIFKKVEHMIARCVITTQEESQAGFYLFATDDLKTYQLVTGKQRTGTELKDFCLLRSFGSAKYYVIVFCATISVNVDYLPSFLGHVDISFISKLAQKIR